MKHNAVLIGVAVIALAVFASAVYAPAAKGDYVKLIGSRVGLTSAWTEYEVCNPTLTDISVASKSKDTFDWYFITAKGSLTDSWLEKRVNVTFKAQVWQKDEKCEDVTEKNSTKWKSCTDNGKFVDADASRWEWQRFDPLGTKFVAGECFRVRVHGTYPFNGAKVDNVIQMAGYDYKEYTWWNASWTYKKPVTLLPEIDRANIQVPLNVSFVTGHMNSDFSDIRFANYTENGELAYWIENYTDSEWAYVWVDVPTPQDIWMYYGNIPAASAASGNATFAFFDDFSGSTTDSPHTWTSSGGGSCAFAESGGWGTITTDAATDCYAYITAPQPALNITYVVRVKADTNRETTWYLGAGDPFGAADTGLVWGEHAGKLEDFVGNWGSGKQMASDLSDGGAHLYRLESWPSDQRVWAEWVNGVNGTTAWTTEQADEIRFLLFNVNGHAYTDYVYIANTTAMNGTTFGSEVAGSPTPNIIISDVTKVPANPTYPFASVTFGANVTANYGSADKAWIDTNITGANARWIMTNSSTWIYNFTFNSIGAGVYNWTIGGNLTDGTSNTTSGTYTVNKAAGAATLSSTAGWTYLTGTATTISCAGTGVNQYVDYALVANPYTNTFPVGTYAVDCNLTSTANYTAASDSETLIVLPAGLLTSAFDETAPNPELVYNLTIYNSSYTKTWTNLGATFFALGNTSLPKGLVTLEYSSAGYGSRTYYETVGGGKLINNTAYLLQTALGGYVRFHTLTTTEVGIPAVLVTVNRTIFGVTTLVGSMLSDSTGTATFFLNPLVSYTVYPTKTGYTSSAATITPGGTSDFKLYMSAIGTLNVTTQFSNLVWNFTPACGGITNSSTTFFYYIQDSNNTLGSYGFDIALPNGTTYRVNATLPGGSRLNITLDLRNFSGRNITITRWFNETGYPLYVFRYGCIVWNTEDPNSLFSKLAGLKGAFCPLPAAGEIPWCLPLNVISLMVTMAVGAVGAARFGANGGGIAAAATLWVMTFLTWWPWQPALLLTLGMLGVIIMTRRMG